MQHKPHTVIWDFNGTLIDDVSALISGMNRVLQRVGRPELDLAGHRKHYQFPMENYFRAVGLPIEEEGVEAVGDEFHEYYMEAVTDCRLHEGVKDLLEGFEKAGVPQFVLSAMYEPEMIALVEALGIRDHFTGLYGLPDKLARSKMERGRDLIREHGIPPADSVFLGDTDHDIEVGRELGLQVILVARGHQPLETLQGTDSPVYTDYGQLICSLGEWFPGTVTKYNRI